MNLLTIIVTIVTCLFGSGGVVIWVLNRHAKKHDDKDTTKKDLREIKEYIKIMQKGLIMCLENDCVIFNALKTLKSLHIFIINQYCSHNN